MPTANHDASLLTKRKRAYTLFSFNNTLKTAVVAGQSVRREQPDTQLQEVLAQRADVTANILQNPNNASDPCQCNTAVDNNLGGNNGKNVG
jgi:hypothetical protein